MSNNLEKLSKMVGQRVRLIVDDHKEIICIPEECDETDEGEKAYRVANVGGKDTHLYGKWPILTEQDIQQIEIL